MTYAIRILTFISGACCLIEAIKQARNPFKPNRFPWHFAKKINFSLKMIVSLVSTDFCEINNMQIDLYALFFQSKPRNILKGIFLLPFQKSCAHRHVPRVSSRDLKRVKKRFITAPKNKNKTGLLLSVMTRYCL